MCEMRWRPVVHAVVRVPRHSAFGPLRWPRAARELRVLTAVRDAVELAHELRGVDLRSRQHRDIEVSDRPVPGG